MAEHVEVLEPRLDEVVMRIPIGVEPPGRRAWHALVYIRPANKSILPIGTPFARRIA
jgi:hypothetical protein